MLGLEWCLLLRLLEGEGLEPLRFKYDSMLMMPSHLTPCFFVQDFLLYKVPTVGLHPSCLQKFEFSVTGV